MKKTLLTVTLLAAISATTMSAEAFCWRNLNPANWGTCPKCEKTASCKCKKEKCTPPCQKQEKVCPESKAACPCKTEPKCEQKCPQSDPCNPCDRLQQETERR